MLKIKTGPASHCRQCMLIKTQTRLVRGLGLHCHMSRWLERSDSPHTHSTGLNCNTLSGVFYLFEYDEASTSKRRVTK